MTEQQRQHLSALADGELDDSLVQPTVTALESSPDMKATWERYHLMGAAIRGEAVTPEHCEIAARVRERLRAEPGVLAPSGAVRERPSRLASYMGIALAAGEQEL